jgi:hypothetical protein
MTTHKQTDESMYILNYNVFELPIELKKISAISIIARSNEILSWEGVGNRQLLCFFKA